MKFKFQYLAAAILFALGTAAFVAFSASDQQVVSDTDGQTYTVWGKEDVITKAFTVDTLTTTEKDTLSLGFQLASPYQYSYQFWIKKLSGTPNLKVVLDTRNSMTNTDWMGIDSFSVSGADSTKTYFLLKGANTWGLQNRLRLVGTTGVNRYRATALLKKTVQ